MAQEVRTVEQQTPSIESAQRIPPRPVFMPPADIYETKDSIVVLAEMPGVTGEDVNLSLQEDVLILSGKREPKAQEQNVSWQRRERAYGSFSRAVQLPFRVDPDKVQARFNNGVLEIELQRLEADRPKKIEIRAA